VSRELLRHGQHRDLRLPSLYQPVPPPALGEAGAQVATVVSTASMSMPAPMGGDFRKGKCA
jgi:hypothetical protein